MKKLLLLVLMVLSLPLYSFDLRRPQKYHYKSQTHYSYHGNIFRSVARSIKSLFVSNGDINIVSDTSVVVKKQEYSDYDFITTTPTRE